MPLERQTGTLATEEAQKFGWSFKIALTLVLLPLFAVLVWMQLSLLPFWALIDSLQILLHLPLLNVQLSGQVSAVTA